MSDPFLKWPGGKRWLVSRFRNIFPQSYRRYVEPFLGGGAVFFHLAPTRAVLSDINPELINAYQMVREHPEALEQRLARLHGRHSEAQYYRIRAEAPSEKLDRAVRFIYLNRSCFNGIYRVNLKGEFNVPMGNKQEIAFETGFLARLAEQLTRSSLRRSDFEKTIDAAGEGDFVYIDPPYTMKHNNNNFIKYNASLFSWRDQIRLANAAMRASDRGAMIMISNADHASIRELYATFGMRYRVSRTSVLAANSAFREGTTELVILNYQLEGTAAMGLSTIPAER
jgi:DNA adenine methylase